MSCFRLENVSYRYDKALVLNGVDLRLEPGEILGLFGHNGAGKTTSIKLILGLMTPSQGKVSVLGGEAGDPKISQYIGYLPENVMFYPQLTGREILAHFARLKGANLRQVPELLGQVGLDDAMDARVKTYSKGMRQRLGLAQALLGKPRLLMLDEPTVGLDPIATADLYRLLRTLRDDGTGIVLCSHVLPGVEPYIDRAAILTDGSLKAAGDLASLRRQANMATTLSIEPEGTVAALETVVNDAKASAGLMMRHENGRLHVDVRPAEKMDLVKALMESGQVRDLGIYEPTLEDVYVHFIGSGGLAHRGGAQ
ncbi:MULTISPECIES: ABC transporter ATP-binding protein [Marinobacter]|uniref:ABC transporter ATP-binding protein n=1 Tax=Marinobacter xiaoshiensis TaxID=3073652 RepID=A0ABU2HM39_9GAMM|nr:MULTISPECIES: ABC transporter ATP-binding protein [unclassified Marinobacter]MBK1873716.1 ABC transporter ATP-binding protein [Marinobacter sp. 1-3A]MBK1885021.1 ABC transporter ATP-binding protein [Marinobacter sp. DY40_1A1]MDS1311400.1 ABC transporter ATP-binding protein [Marinobacter sp. F60267]